MSSAPPFRIFDDELPLDEAMSELDEATLQELYGWIDQIPLSRPKRNLTRDFSDGVMVAELVKYYFPRLVELHNYSPANSTKQKIDNWFVLNRRIFRKMRFEITEDVIKQIAVGKPWVIEHVLLLLRGKIDKILREQGDTNGLAAINKSPQTYNSDQPDVAQFASPLGKKPTNQQPTPAVISDTSKRLFATQRTYRQTAEDSSVPRILLEEKEQQLLAKEEVIQILQAKIRRLEHLVHLKDIRIEDLQAKLDELHLPSSHPISKQPPGAPTAKLKAY